MSYTVKCPYCAEEIKSEASICKHCNKKLTGLVASWKIIQQVQELEKQSKNKELDDLIEKNAERLSRYYKMKANELRKNLSKLKKLDAMSDKEFEEDVCKSKRKTIIIWLAIFSFIIWFISPFFLLITIWLYPKKDESTLLPKKRFKKIWIIRILLSILVLIFSIVGFVNNQELKEIENTQISVDYNITEDITTNDTLTANVSLSNITSLSINGKDIDISWKSIFEDIPLKIGNNTISIIWKNWDIERTTTKNIKRVTQEEYNEIQKKEEEIKKQQDEARKEQEKKQEEQIAREQAERIEKLKEERLARIWSYSENTDKMSWIKSKFAQTEWTNRAYFEFPYNWWSNFLLSLRKKWNSATEVIFKVSKWQILWNYSWRTVRLKFDDKTPFNVNYWEPSDWSSDTIFLRNTNRIIQELKTSKKLMLEVEYHQEWRHIAEFDVEWLNW